MQPFYAAHGGSWVGNPGGLRSAGRFGFSAVFLDDNLGFRVMRHTKPPRRVVRGGSWYHNPKVARSAYRDGVEPGIRIDFIGFRVVKNLT